MIPDPYRLRNATARPVELHRADTVVVLDPGSFIEVEAADPALDALERSGVLTRHPSHAPRRPGPPPAPAASPRGKHAPRRTRRASTPKRPAAADSGELP